jgi:hypothetical protein
LADPSVTEITYAYPLGKQAEDARPFDGPFTVGIAEAKTALRASTPPPPDQRFATLACISHWEGRARVEVDIGGGHSKLE